jgi:Zn-dependent peptidase ImmA (M78 family)/transcriptional regulator with XRE-family HTH domain
MPLINPDVASWARESAGMSLEEAAAKLRLGTKRDPTGVQRLQALEQGEEQPTRALLVKMAKVYHRPLLAFYLDAPPRPSERGHDFRALPSDHTHADDVVLNALIRDIQARQGIVRSAVIDEDEAGPLPFVGTYRARDGADAILNSMRKTLDVSVNDIRMAQEPDAIFQLLRAQAETVGVYVILLGNLGSHHTNIGLDIFRGFALADTIAPFVIVNDQDSHRAWSFTLLHELAHIWLGQTGVSGGTAFADAEALCNDVASKFLLPDSELAALRVEPSSGAPGLAASIAPFADSLGLSISMVGYRLFRRGTIDRTAWLRLSDYLSQRWRESRADARARQRDRPGGPSYYTVRRHPLGAGLIQLTARLMASGALTTCKAGRILGVKPKNVQALIGA